MVEEVRGKEVVVRGGGGMRCSTRGRRGEKGRRWVLSEGGRRKWRWNEEEWEKTEPEGVGRDTEKGVWGIYSKIRAIH